MAVIWDGEEKPSNGGWFAALFAVVAFIAYLTLAEWAGR